MKMQYSHTEYISFLQAFNFNYDTVSASSAFDFFEEGARHSARCGTIQIPVYDSSFV